MSKAYEGQLRALQIVDDRGRILNERHYGFGVDDPAPLRAELERIRAGWHTSGALSDRFGASPALRIIDVPYKRK